jgi:hypothetical protein
MPDEPAPIERIDVEQELRACPACDYERGFHASFIREKAPGDDKALRVVLICPSCGARYDIGLFV